VGSRSTPTPCARRRETAINLLEAEIADPVAQVAPQLPHEPGFGPLTAAKLVGEIAGAARFSSDAKLARAAGLAPITVSSGRTDRHRLDRGGNRQINAVIHRVAVTRAGCHAETIEFVARRKAEGKTHREAVRSLNAVTRPPHLPALARAPPGVRNGTPPINSLTEDSKGRRRRRALRRGFLQAKSAVVDGRLVVGCSPFRGRPVGSASGGSRTPRRPGQG
jgi:hypothetical protein